MKVVQHVRLLEIDSVINLVVGAVLLVIPKTTIAFFGLPPTNTVFYVSILGAILTGVGVALWIECRSNSRWSGLGLAGAVVINLLGGGTVLVWLVLDSFTIARQRPCRIPVPLLTTARDSRVSSSRFGGCEHRSGSHCIRLQQQMP